MKVVRVPIDSISILGSDAKRVKDYPYVEFCRAVLSGGDPFATPYAALYRKMVAEGWLYTTFDVDAYLRKRAGLVTSAGPFEGVRCSLESDGTFLLRDGHHRACNAVAVGETHIDVIVAQVSPLVADLDAVLGAVYKVKRQLYQPIEHPWWDDWPVLRDNRWAMILPTIERMEAAGEINQPGSDHLKCVDIGSCSGGIARNLWRRGYQVFGLDCDPDIIRVAEGLNRLLGTNVRYCQCDVIAIANATPCEPFGAEERFHWQFAYAFQYQIAVCFSLLHHWVNAGDRASVVKLLQAMVKRSVVLFLDCPSDKDRWFLKYEPSEAKALYLEALAGYAWESLGIDKDGREVLAFYRGAP